MLIVDFGALFIHTYSAVLALLPAGWARALVLLGVLCISICRYQVPGTWYQYQYLSSSYCSLRCTTRYLFVYVVYNVQEFYTKPPCKKPVGTFLLRIRKDASWHVLRRFRTFWNDLPVEIYFWKHTVSFSRLSSAIINQRRIGMGVTMGGMNIVYILLYEY
jgi:hypothetical protein